MNAAEVLVATGATRARWVVRAQRVAHAVNAAVEWKIGQEQRAEARFHRRRRQRRQRARQRAATARVLVSRIVGWWR